MNKITSNVKRPAFAFFFIGFLVLFIAGSFFGIQEPVDFYLRMAGLVMFVIASGQLTRQSEVSAE